MKAQRGSALGWILAAAILLTGCASPVPKVDLTEEMARSIDTITIVRPPQRLGVAVQNLGHPGMAFGAIGGLVAAADAKRKTEAFTAAMASHKFSVTDVLTRAIERRLTAAGYKVTLIDGVWEEKEGRFALQKDKLVSEGNLLILMPRIVGFVSTVTADYMPTLWVIATLESRDRKEIYRGYHSTGWQPSVGEWKHTKPARIFRNFDELMAKTEESASALTDSADFISASIVGDLRGPASHR
jgi:hypothetical protein